MNVCYVVFKDVFRSPGYTTRVNWDCNAVDWFGPSDSYLMVPPEGWDCN